ncbi:unnamed protein product [Paramecium octaurelia]|uniref:Uncharacterized protein n=1 Tax=Paramecium octaurelia TaxID=43137 RepID=A0A8S1Y9Y0_PAROT|nr:unnamed protein product [Paramecium octaurelia]
MKSLAAIIKYSFYIYKETTKYNFQILKYKYMILNFKSIKLHTILKIVATLIKDFHPLLQCKINYYQGITQIVIEDSLMLNASLLQQSLCSKSKLHILHCYEYFHYQIILNRSQTLNQGETSKFLGLCQIQNDVQTCTIVK